MNKLLIVVMVTKLSLISPDAFAACSVENTAIVSSTPSRYFSVHDDGTVTHYTTGLMWMQCSLGQNSLDGNCVGLATRFTWKQALQEANDSNHAGYSDWRLPNKKELVSIVEERCYRPAINTKIFPNTSFGFYWSSTPVSSRATSAWFVNFSDGIVTGGTKSSSNPYFNSRVRLVRDVN